MPPPPEPDAAERAARGWKREVDPPTSAYAPAGPAIRAVGPVGRVVFAVLTIVIAVSGGVLAVSRHRQGEQSSAIQHGVSALLTVTSQRRVDHHMRYGTSHTTYLRGSLDEPGSPQTVTTVPGTVNVADGGRLTVLHAAGKPGNSELPGRPQETPLSGVGFGLLAAGLTLLVGSAAAGQPAHRHGGRGPRPARRGRAVRAVRAVHAAAFALFGAGVVVLVVSLA